MRGRLLAGLSALTLFAGACSQDTAGPVANVPRPSVPLAPTVGDPDLATLISQQLTCLYEEGLLPNEQSSLGKFRNIQSLVAANDLPGAGAATGNLVGFIELKFSQYTGPATIDCSPPVPGYPNPVSVALLKDDVITNLWAYVGLTGEICEVPAGEPKLCKTSDQTSGFVYFPDDIFTQVTFVGIEQNPPGLTALQDLFDEYPNRVRIVTTGLNDFSGFTLKPIVVVCFNDALVPDDASVAARLLVGARHESGFEFLPSADFSQYPPEVLAEAVNMCGLPESTSSMFSPGTTLGRIGNELLQLLLPKPLQASVMRQLAFGGAGGATEQFSDFGIVDRGATAFGGAGGATEQFAPPAAVKAAGERANASYDPNTSTVTGVAGETESDAADLPSVKVVAPVSLTGIPGVQVTFTLLDPITSPYSSSPSLATLCGATTVPTGADGSATLPCLNFGTKAGYKNLRVTFDPTGVDPLACIIGSTGACDNSTDVNFLVQTNAGPAALIKPYMPPDTAAQLFSYGINLTPYLPVNPAPRARVTDQYGNVVGSNVPVFWSTNTSTGSVLDVTGGTQTGSLGTAQVTSWTLGEGVNQLFASLYDNLTTPPVGFLPAEFRATTPTGVPIFTCGIGASKIDLGPFTIPAPNNILRDITLQMSVTGQSSAISSYQANLSVRAGSFNGPEVGVGSGTVALPGNNGSPTSVTFHLTTPVPRQTGGGTSPLWFRLTVTVPPTRKIQLWYNASFPNNSPCKDAKIYSPTYPSPSGVVKAGLSIVATN